MNFSAMVEAYSNRSWWANWLLFLCNGGSLLKQELVGQLVIGEPEGQLNYDGRGSIHWPSGSGPASLRSGCSQRRLQVSIPSNILLQFFFAWKCFAQLFYNYNLTLDFFGEIDYRLQFYQPLIVYIHKARPL